MGWVHTGRTLVMHWSGRARLAPGAYHVTVTAHDHHGNSLLRRAHASGVAAMTVTAVTPPAAPPTPPAPVPAPQLEAGVPVDPGHEEVRRRVDARRTDREQGRREGSGGERAERGGREADAEAHRDRPGDYAETGRGCATPPTRRQSRPRVARCDPALCQATGGLPRASRPTRESEDRSHATAAVHAQPAAAKVRAVQASGLDAGPDAP